MQFKADVFGDIYIGQRLNLILGYIQGHSWLPANSNLNAICKIIWFWKDAEKHILNCHLLLFPIHARV